jgi:hypothetical protein
VDEVVSAKVVAASGDKALLDIGGIQVLSQTGVSLRQGDEVLLKVSAVTPDRVELKLLPRDGSAQLPQMLVKSLEAMDVESSPQNLQIAKDAAEYGFPPTPENIEDIIGLNFSPQEYGEKKEAIFLARSLDLPLTRETVNALDGFLKGRETLGRDLRTLGDLLNAIKNGDAPQEVIDVFKNVNIDGMLQKLRAHIDGNDLSSARIRQVVRELGISAEGRIASVINGTAPDLENAAALLQAAASSEGGVSGKVKDLVAGIVRGALTQMAGPDGSKAPGPSPGGSSIVAPQLDGPDMVVSKTGGPDIVVPQPDGPDIAVPQSDGPDIVVTPPDVQRAAAPDSDGPPRVDALLGDPPDEGAVPTEEGVKAPGLPGQDGAGRKGEISHGVEKDQPGRLRSAEGEGSGRERAADVAAKPPVRDGFAEVRESLGSRVSDLARRLERALEADPALQDHPVVKDLQRILRSVEDVLTGQKIVNASPRHTDDEGRQYISIPLTLPGAERENRGELKIFVPKQKKKKQEKEPLKVTFILTTDHLGVLGIDLGIIERRIDCAIKVENEPVRLYVEENTHLLKKGLEALDYVVGDIRTSIGRKTFSREIPQKKVDLSRAGRIDLRV